MPTLSDNQTGLRRLCAGLMLLTGASWVLCALANFPAVMTPDSLDQWGQVLSGRYSNWHPVAHTLWVKLTSFNGTWPATVIAAQIVLMLGAVAGTLLLAVQLGASVAAILATGFYFALVPFHGAMLVCLWKDIPFAAALTGFTLGLVFVSGRPASPFAARYGWWLGGTGLALALLRHNGVLCPIAGIAALMAAQPGWRRPLALCLLAVLAATAAWWMVVRYGFKAASSPVTELLAQPLQQVATVVAADPAAITPAQREKLGAIVPWPVWATHQNRQNVDDIKFNAALDPAPLAADPFGYLRVWAGLVRANPRVALVAALRQNAVAWDPAVPARDIYPTGIAPNPFGLKSTPPFPRLTAGVQQIYAAAGQIPWQWLARPALCNLLLLGAAGVAFYRARWRGLAPFAPWLVNTAALAALLPMPDFRYFYPAFATLPTLLLHAGSLRLARATNAAT